MKVYNETFKVNLKSGEIKDITNDVNEIVRKSEVSTGIVNIFSVGSTASITTIEYERGVINDLKKALNRLIPDNISYEHDLAWHDGNGYSHVRSAILGPSITIPVKNSTLSLGTWQQIIIINHDVRTRERKIEVTIIGE